MISGLATAALSEEGYVAPQGIQLEIRVLWELFPEDIGTN